MSVSIHGYVHKFRLEAREEAAALAAASRSTEPNVSLGALLGKFVLVAVVLLALVASIGIAQSAEAADTAKTAILTRAQFDELLSKPEQLLVIDVRRPDEITAIGGLLAAKGFNVVGRIGVQNYEAEGGKLTKIAPKAPT